MKRIRIARRAGSDSGFSLMELLVVVSLLSVVGTMVLSTIIVTSKIQRKNDSIITQRVAAQTALERMGRDLTVANPLTAAAAADVSMKVYVKGYCEVHRYYISGTTLSLDVSRYPASTTCTTATGTLGTAATTVLARGVSNGSVALFTYSKWSSTSNARTNITAPVASVSVGTVDRVEMDLRMTTTDGQPIAETESVDLRNVEIR
ncbi:MAG TPA: prepilin-type N-terminal cleavage/methylation domain-containing protein [Actinomycetes bacterium]|nr:prepilin-type N-terminal cleavage/methylation domain-containing protein [Actinomycetes bacterium]